MVSAVLTVNFICKLICGTWNETARRRSSCLLKTETLKPTPFLTSCRLVQLREDQGFGEGRQDKGKAAEP